MNKRSRELLEFIYGSKTGRDTAGRLETLVESRMQGISAPNTASEPAPGSLPVSETDAIVITYGDQFTCPGKRRLECLKGFADRYLAGIVDGMHILPFFPYSSDDGFSIIDYKSVNSEMGTWKDVSAVGESSRLMSDLVLNHCSAKSDWFQGFLSDDPAYRSYFITVDPDEDLSMIVRPRDLPLLTPFQTAAGEKHVWTTFSADQVDLNFANPDVLLEMIDVFLFHVSHGIQIIRLDAIAYTWKEIGHPSIHHPKTHAIVKLFRSLVDEYVPWVLIITETNVPHEENISYFGDGTDEAQMIYQFSLPPLVLDAFLRSDTSHLRTWAAGLEVREQPVTFFNFLASHDGIGVTPAHGILSETEIESMISEVKRRNGLVSYKATKDGKIPYELNINYRDAIAPPSASDEERARAFLASQSIMLSMAGVPGIYIHSIIGSGNYGEGVERTGMNRTINREKLDLADIERELERDDSVRALVYRGFRDMLEVRRSRAAFHPQSPQKILPTSDAVFGLLRGDDDVGRVVCLVNTAESESTVELSYSDLELPPDADLSALLRSGRHRTVRTNRGVSFSLGPHEVAWFE